MSVSFGQYLKNSLRYGYDPADAELVPKVEVIIYRHDPNHIIIDEDKLSFDELKKALDQDLYGDDHDMPILDDSFEITESIQSGSTIDFIGCVTRSLTFKILSSDIKFDLRGLQTKDTYVEAYMYCDKDPKKTQVFVGKIDSIEGAGGYALDCTIKAYDFSYKEYAEKDMTVWYDGLWDKTKHPDITYDASGKMKFKAFRDEFFKELKITQEPAALMLDDVWIAKTIDTSIKTDDKGLPVKDDAGKEERNSTISANTIAKCICQANASCGRINGEGRFEYTIMVKNNDEHPYYGPDWETSTTAKTIFSDRIESLDFKNTKFEKVTAVVAYDPSSEEYKEKGTAIYYCPPDEPGKDDNKKMYIEDANAQPLEIKDNFLFNGLAQEAIKAPLQALYDRVKDISIVPFTANIRFFDVHPGDCIWLEVPYGTNHFNGAVNDEKAPLIKKSYVKTYVMSVRMTGTKMVMQEISTDGEAINGAPQSLNEIISSERFYRMIGDNNLRSEFEQTAEEIRMAIITGDKAVQSMIDIQADRITLEVERFGHEKSAITSRIQILDNEISIHAENITMLAKNFDLVAERATITLNELQAVIKDVAVVKSNMVIFEDLQDPNSRTIIHGGNIETGTLSCNTLKATKMVIGGTDIDMDWGWLPPIQSYDVYEDLPGVGQTSLEVCWDSKEVVTDIDDDGKPVKETIWFLVLKDDTGHMIQPGATGSNPTLIKPNLPVSVATLRSVQTK